MYWFGSDSGIERAPSRSRHHDVLATIPIQLLVPAVLFHTSIETAEGAPPIGVARHAGSRACPGHEGDRRIWCVYTGPRRPGPIVAITPTPGYPRNSTTVARRAAKPRDFSESAGSSKGV